MRIRDWSSDVCSSDLPGFRRGALPRASLGVRAADVQRQPVGPLRAWLSDLIRGSAAPAVEKGQPLEQHDVLLLLLKRAVQWRNRSEEHTSELQSLMRTTYAVFCLNKKITPTRLRY